ncbi:MAG: hypothetical protein AAGM67_07185, partial [Bacteroidota bacterium]
MQPPVDILNLSGLLADHPLVRRLVSITDFHEVDTLSFSCQIHTDLEASEDVLIDLTEDYSASRVSHLDRQLICREIGGGYEELTFRWVRV